MQTSIAHRPLRAFAFALAGLGALAVLLAPSHAPAQSALERFNDIQGKLNEVEDREGVLTTTISRYNDRIDSLRGEIADLRNREAVVEKELARIQAELSAAEARLAELRARLQRSLEILSQRLVDIYKSNEPDALTVILESDGFGDLLERDEYLQRIQNMESGVIVRVRDLRDQTETTVEQITVARDEVAAKERELEQTRTQLESRNAELAAARTKQQSALGSVREQKKELEGDLSEVSKQVQEQLAGASSPLPAGPIQGAAGGFIWPVSGPITSGFGPRWGRVHEGIDIAAPGGTPIRAAKTGRIVIAAPTGGYGNYTCLDHGGGLSTCYAHQSGFARTSGSINQGEVLGYVGNTGASFGNHLHFEIRVNGAATDPMGYL